jgi:hypothetical protein
VPQYREGQEAKNAGKTHCYSQCPTQERSEGIEENQPAIAAMVIIK